MKKSKEFVAILNLSWYKTRFQIRSKKYEEAAHIHKLEHGEKEKFQYKIFLNFWATLKKFSIINMKFQKAVCRILTDCSRYMV